MRRILLSSALIALLAGPVAAQAPSSQAPSSEPAPPQQAAPSAAPPTGAQPEVKHPVSPETSAAPQPAPAKPDAATKRPDAPGGSPLAGPQQQREGQKATSGTPLPSSGARQEPGTTEQTGQKVADGPVLVNGRLNAPGAPQDGHTVPAKTSERNAKLDAMPMLQPRR